MKVIKKYFFTSVCAGCIQIAMSFTRLYLGIEMSTFIGFTAYFILQIFLSKTLKGTIPFKICLAITFAILTLQLPIRIISFDSTSVTFIDFIFHLLGSPFALLIYNLNNKKAQKYLIASSFLLVAISSIYINKLWKNKLDYGTFTGEIKSKSIIELTGKDEKGKRISSSSFKNKTILIDFWHTRCLACFKKFPKLQVIHDQFKNDSNFVILAANHPLKDDSTNQAYDMMKKRNYTFKTFILENDKVAAKVGVNFFPTTLIINKKGEMIFSGEIEVAAKKLEEIKREK